MKTLLAFVVFSCFNLNLEGELAIALDLKVKASWGLPLFSRYFLVLTSVLVIVCLWV